MEEIFTMVNLINPRNYPAYRPYSNVQPFTVRDGATHLLTLEALRAWIRDTLLPHIDTEISGLESSWETQNDDMRDLFESAIQDVVNISSQTGGILSETEALKILIDEAAEAASDSATQAASYASDAANIQDEAITGIFNDPLSLFKQALDARYATISALGAVSDVIETGRLSASAIDGRFDDVANDFDSMQSQIQNVNDDIDALPVTITGEFDNRISPSSVAAGSVFICTDVPEQYVSDGISWQVFGSGGNEIGSAAFTGPVTSITSVTAVPVPAFTITFKVGYRPIVLSLFARIAASNAEATPRAHIYLDGAGVTMLEGAASSARDSWRSVFGKIRVDSLIPGSVHTAVVALSCSAGPIILSGDGFNSILSVETV